MYKSPSRKFMLATFVAASAMIVAMLLFFVLNNNIDIEQTSIQEENLESVEIENSFFNVDEMIQKDMEENPEATNDEEFKTQWIKEFGRTSYFDYLWSKFIILESGVLPDGAMNNVIYSNDFNGDGINEQINYYQIDKDGLLNYIFVVYHFDEKENIWVKDFEDSGEEYDVFIDPSYFYNQVDIDNDGSDEILINRVLEYSGGFIEKYILKWQDNKVAKIDLPKTVDVIEENNLVEFLQEGEEFGVMDLFTEDGGYIFICSSNTSCASKESGINSLGKINFTVNYIDKEWLLSGFLEDRI